MLAGRIIIALAPDALVQLSSGRSTVLVSGTNGKTTTTAMIVASLGGDVATNNSGANMDAGIVAAYARSASSTAVMEVDELYVSAIGNSVAPSVFVALNLSRDQMDRIHEVSTVVERWSRFLNGSDAHVIANAKDPNVVAAVGSHSATWIDPGWEITDDSRVCPRCTALLDWDSSGWACRCGLRQPAADYVVDGDVLHVAPGTSVPLDLGSGRAAVGSTLKCNRLNDSEWAVASTSRVWLRNGKVISGATGRSYTVRSKDSGKNISCRVAVTFKPAFNQMGARAKAVKVQ